MSGYAEDVEVQLLLRIADAVDRIVRTLEQRKLLQAPEDRPSPRARDLDEVTSAGIWTCELLTAVQRDDGDRQERACRELEQLGIALAIDESRARRTWLPAQEVKRGRSRSQKRKGGAR